MCVSKAQPSQPRETFHVTTSQILDGAMSTLRANAAALPGIWGGIYTLHQKEEKTRLKGEETPATDHSTGLGVTVRTTAGARLAPTPHWPSAGLLILLPSGKVVTGEQPFLTFFFWCHKLSSNSLKTQKPVMLMPETKPRASFIPGPIVPKSEVSSRKRYLPDACSLEGKL